MGHQYSSQSMVILPRLTSSTAYALITQVLTAAADRENQLLAQGQTLPIMIVRSRDRLMEAQASLGSAMQQAPASPSETRDADTAIDNAWGGFYNFLQAWTRMPSGTCPDLDGVKLILRDVFVEELTFLKLDFRSEWAQSQNKLETLSNSPYMDTINRIGGQPFVEGIKNAQVVYGNVLGLTAVKEDEPGSMLGTTRNSALNALREYVVKALAWSDPEESGSEALSEALLAPLASWESPKGESSSTSSSSTAQTSSATASSASTTGSLASSTADSDSQKGRSA